tara:strand:- start:210 stop:1097 length:888 start_codon:yes stop_codon:yes gene_type:complete
MNIEDNFRNITLNDIHLVNCIISSIREKRNLSGHMRILEVGCGSGTFLLYMIDMLSKTFPKITFDFHAFDLQESELIFNDEELKEPHLSRLHLVLKRKYKNGNWERKIKIIKPSDDWHEQLEFFDLIVSNQVLEHVMDKPTFFNKLSKNLKLSGNSFHIFPALDVFWEWHIHVPFAHWFKSEKMLRKYITLYRYFTSPVKFFKNHKLMMNSINHDAKYIFDKTHYCSTKQFIKYCHDLNLSVNLKYTYPYYFLKACQWLKIDINKFNFYSCNRFLHYLTFFITKHISSITVHISK